MTDATVVRYGGDLYWLVMMSVHGDGMIYIVSCPQSTGAIAIGGELVVVGNVHRGMWVHPLDVEELYMETPQ